MIYQKNLDNKNEKEKTKKYNFQGQFERSNIWFDLDQEWLKEIFSKREPEFYIKLYQMDIEGQEVETYQIFVVPVGNENIT